MNGLRRLLAYLIWLPLLGFTLSADAQKNPAKGPSAQLISFAPAADELLIKGEPLAVTAKLDFEPSSDESIQFTSTLKVNRHRFHPQVTVLTRRTNESDVSGKVTITWNARVPARTRAAIQFKVSGIGTTSSQAFAFVEINREYIVRCQPNQCWLLRYIHHLFGCCTT